MSYSSQILDSLTVGIILNEDEYYALFRKKNFLSVELTQFNTSVTFNKKKLECKNIGFVNMFLGEDGEGGLGWVPSDYVDILGDVFVKRIKFACTKKGYIILSISTENSSVS